MGTLWGLFYFLYCKYETPASYKTSQSQQASAQDTELLYPMLDKVPWYLLRCLWMSIISWYLMGGFCAMCAHDHYLQLAPSLPTGNHSTWSREEPRKYWGNQMKQLQDCWWTPLLPFRHLLLIPYENVIWISGYSLWVSIALSDFTHNPFLLPR